MAQAVAAAAAAAAAAVIDPLNEVKDILEICGFGNNADRFIQCHDITNIGTFELMLPDEVEDIVKMHNSCWKRPEQKTVYPVQKALQGFLWWYHDNIRRQEAV